MAIYRNIFVSGEFDGLEAGTQVQSIDGTIRIFGESAFASLEDAVLAGVKNAVVRVASGKYDYYVVDGEGNVNAADQVFYVNFKGGNGLSYDNGEYSRSVDMAPAQYTAAEQQEIVDALNDRNAAAGKVFTAEEPAAGSVYSTINVGSTTSFDDLGSFKGLSETIDAGNLIPTDEAFVNTDKIADIADAVEVIDHEAGHLTGETHDVETGTITDFADAAGTATYNGTAHATISEAVAAAKGDDDAVITLDGALNGNVVIDNGQKVTFTGTASINWGVGHFLIGRSGSAEDSGNNTVSYVTFKDATITTASNWQKTTGFNISGASDDSKTHYGSLTIEGSNIECDYVIARHILDVNNSTLTAGNLYIYGRGASESPSDTDEKSVMTVRNKSYVKVLEENGMPIGGEGGGILNITGKSTFEMEDANNNYGDRTWEITAKGAVNISDDSHFIVNKAIGGGLVNNGVITIDGTSSLVAEKLTNNGTISIDVTGVGTNWTKLIDTNGTFTNSGAIQFVKDGEVVTDGYNYALDDGDLSVKAKVYVAEVNGVKYETLSAAYLAAAAGSTTAAKTVQLLVSEIDTVAGIPSGVTLIGAEGKTKVKEGLQSQCFDNVTVKNISFYRVYMSYLSADSSCVFENCDFNNPTGAYSLHFDGYTGDILVKDSYLTGWNTFGSGIKSITFDGCTIDANENYCELGPFINTTFTNCKFTEAFAKKDLYGSGLEIRGGTNVVFELTNCKIIKSADDPTDSTEYTILDALDLDLSNDTLMFAIDAVKDGEGKYTSGTFAANVASTIDDKLATKSLAGIVGASRGLVYELSADGKAVEIRETVAGTLNVSKTVAISVAAGATYDSNATLTIDATGITGDLVKVFDTVANNLKDGDFASITITGEGSANYSAKIVDGDVVVYTSAVDPGSATEYHTGAGQDDVAVIADGQSEKSVTIKEHVEVSGNAAISNIGQGDFEVGDVTAGGNVTIENAGTGSTTVTGDITADGNATIANLGTGSTTVTGDTTVAEKLEIRNETVNELSHSGKLAAKDINIYNNEANKEQAGEIGITQQMAAVGDINIQNTAVAGKIGTVNLGTQEHTADGNVTILNAADNVINGGVSGTTEQAANVTAQGNVVIDNDGHINMNITAGGGMTITNTSTETLIGEYTALTGDIALVNDGAAQDVTFNATNGNVRISYNSNAGTTANAIINTEDLWLGGTDLEMVGGSVIAVHLDDADGTYKPVAGGTFTYAGGSVGKIVGADVEDYTGITKRGDVVIDNTADLLATVAIENVDTVTIASGTQSFGASAAGVDYYFTTAAINSGATLQWNFADSDEMTYNVGTPLSNDAGMIAVTGAGTLAFEQTGEYSLGDLDVSGFTGKITVASASEITLEEATDYSASGSVIENAGTVNFEQADAAAQMAINNAGTVNVNADTTFAAAIDNDSVINVNTSSVTFSALDNDGTVNVEAEATVAGAIDNDGAINVKAASTVAAALTGAGAVNVNADAEFTGDVSAFTGTYTAAADKTGTFTSASTLADSFKLEGAGSFAFEDQAADIVVETDTDDATNLAAGNNNVTLTTNGGLFGDITGTASVTASAATSAANITATTLNANAAVTATKVTAAATNISITVNGTIAVTDSTSGFGTITVTSDTADFTDNPYLLIDSVAGQTYADSITFTVGSDSNSLEINGAAVSYGDYFVKAYTNEGDLYIASFEYIGTPIWVNSDWSNKSFGDLVYWPTSADERIIGSDAAGSLDNAIGYVKGDDNHAAEIDIVKGDAATQTYTIGKALIQEGRGITSMTVAGNQEGGSQEESFRAVIEHGDVFGRSAAVDAAADATTVTLKDLTVRGKVYGGAKIDATAAATAKSTLKIDGGLMGGSLVAGGSYVAGGEYTVSASELVIGGANATQINGRVIGGSVAASGATVTATSASVTIDATNKVILRNDIYAAGAGAGVTTDETTVTFTGAASNLNFTGRVSGGAYGQAIGDFAGNSELVFADFNGTFKGLIQDMDVITVKGESAVAFSRKQTLMSSTGFNFDITGRTAASANTAMYTVNETWGWVGAKTITVAAASVTSGNYTIVGSWADYSGFSFTVAGNTNYTLGMTVTDAAGNSYILNRNGLDLVLTFGNIADTKVINPNQPQSADGKEFVVYNTNVTDAALTGDTTKVEKITATAGTTVVFHDDTYATGGLLDTNAAGAMLYNATADNEIVWVGNGVEATVAGDLTGSSMNLSGRSLTVNAADIDAVTVNDDAALNLVSGASTIGTITVADGASLTLDVGAGASISGNTISGAAGTVTIANAGTLNTTITDAGTIVITSNTSANSLYGTYGGENTESITVESNTGKVSGASFTADKVELVNNANGFYADITVNAADIALTADLANFTGTNDTIYSFANAAEIDSLHITIDETTSFGAKTSVALVKGANIAGTTYKINGATAKLGSITFIGETAYVLDAFNGDLYLSVGEITPADMSKFIVDAALSTVEAGTEVVYDGKLFTVGTNAFGSLDAAFNVYGDHDHRNTETTEIAIKSDLTSTGTAKQFFYSDVDVKITASSDVTVDMSSHSRVYFMGYYDVTKYEGAPSSVPTFTIGENVNLSVGQLMAGQAIDNPDDVDAEGTATRDPGAAHIVINGTVYARQNYATAYSTIDVADGGKLLKHPTLYGYGDIMRAGGTINVVGDGTKAEVQYGAGYLQVQNGTLNVKDTWVSTGTVLLQDESAKDADFTPERTGDSTIVIDNSKFDSSVSMTLGYDAAKVILKNGSEFTISGAVTNNGTIEIADSTLTAGGTLTNSGKITASGTTTVTATGFSGNTIRLADGATAKDWNVSGTASRCATLDGTVTFKGDNTLLGIGMGKYGTGMIVGKGDSLTLTNNRLTVAYDLDFSITGEIADALTADKASTAVSVDLKSGISFTGDGTNTVMTVKDAYVKTGMASDKDATGTFNMNFTNSIVDFTNVLSISQTTGTFNTTFDHSVVTIASHLKNSLAGATLILKNGTQFTVNGSTQNYGDFQVLSGSFADLKSYTNSSHGGQTGTVTVSGEGSTFKLKTKANDQWQNSGTVTVNNGGSLIVDYITNSGAIAMDYASTLTGTALTSTGTITIDAAGYTGGVYKVIDLDQSTSLEGAVTISGLDTTIGTVLYGADGDVVITDFSDGTLYVNTAWNGLAEGTQVTAGDTVAVIGTNAFDTMQGALDTAKETAGKDDIVFLSDINEDFVGDPGIRNVNLLSGKEGGVTIVNSDYSYLGNTVVGENVTLNADQTFPFGENTINGTLLAPYQFYTVGGKTTVGPTGYIESTNTNQPSIIYNDTEFSIVGNAAQGESGEARLQMSLNPVDMWAGAITVKDAKAETGRITMSGATANHSIALDNATLKVYAGDFFSISTAGNTTIDVTNGSTLTTTMGIEAAAGTAINVSDSTLTVGGTLTNNGVVNISGNSTVTAESVSGNAVNLLDGVTLTDSKLGAVNVYGTATLSGDTTVTSMDIGYKVTRGTQNLVVNVTGDLNVSNFMLGNSEGYTATLNIGVADGKRIAVGINGTQHNYMSRSVVNAVNADVIGNYFSFTGDITLTNSTYTKAGDFRVVAGADDAKVTLNASTLQGSTGYIGGWSADDSGYGILTLKNGSTWKSNSGTSVTAASVITIDDSEFIVTGTLTNRGTITADKESSISAAGLTNKANGNITGDVTMTSGNNTLTLDVDSVLNGAVDMGAGTDTVAVTGVKALGEDVAGAKVLAAGGVANAETYKIDNVAVTLGEATQISEDVWAKLTNDDSLIVAWGRTEEEVTTAVTAFAEDNTLQIGEALTATATDLSENGVEVADFKKKSNGTLA